MAKQGMGRGKRFFRSGLLIFLLFLFIQPYLFSQDMSGDTFWSVPPPFQINEPEIESDNENHEEETPAVNITEVIEIPLPIPLELHVETTPLNPMVNNPWNIIIMVNHPNPSQVNVRLPDLPSILQMDDRVRVDARLFRGETWTRVEYSFIPRRAETITLAPFTVVVQDRQVQTSSIRATFREVPVVIRTYTPRLRWLGTVPVLNTGTRAEIILELSDWNPELPLPGGFLQGIVPPNAIINERNPVDVGEGIYHYPFHIIALEGESVSLNTVSYNIGQYTLTVPALRFNVLSLPELSENEEMEDYEERTGGIVQAAALTGGSAGLPFFLQGSYNRIVENTMSLWEDGKRAEALAEIRRHERDSPAGIFLSSMRIEMEELLGLGFTENESWRPLRVHPFSWVVSFILIVLSVIFLLVCRPKKSIARFSSVSRPHKGLKFAFILLLMTGISFILYEEGIRKLIISPLNPSSNAIVAERTSIYRIPDFNSGIIAYFPEGQPVITRELNGEWRYAETIDGRSGWVPVDSLITY